MNQAAPSSYPHDDNTFHEIAAAEAGNTVTAALGASVAAAAALSALLFDTWPSAKARSAGARLVWHRDPNAPASPLAGSGCPGSLPC